MIPVKVPASALYPKYKTLEISAEDARYLIGGDLDDWEVVEENCHGTSRWEVQYTSIVKNTESGKFYSIDWSRGATEQQDTQPFEYSDPKLIEVEGVEVVKTEWRYVKNDK